MRRPASAFALAACVIVSFGACTRQGRPADVIVRGKDCAVEIGGRSMTHREMLAALRARLAAKREVHVRATMDVPYKCIGAVVYEMQRAGLGSIDFVQDPSLR